MSFYPFVLHEISVLVELILGHLRSVVPEQGIGLAGSPQQVLNIPASPLVRAVATALPKATSRWGQTIP
jgi:hypothetical protein